MKASDFLERKTINSSYPIRDDRGDILNEE